ncbi:YVTN family beta-propeller protein [Streptomyces sp. Ag109_G2-6]|nr:YncE family protein [Streptomyces katrae]RPF30116.1 YVTN family beta-propeller protein [Streptomyces sp. Ag109_G2-6]
MTTSDVTDAPLDRLIARAQEEGLQVSRVPAERPPSSAADLKVKRIPAGQSPHSVAVSPDGTRLYVTNFQAGTVSVIDTLREVILEAIHVVEGPYGVAANPDGRTLHVASPGSKTLVMLDLSNGFHQGSGISRAPYGVAVSPKGGPLYLTLAQEDSILVTDHFGKGPNTRIPGVRFPTGVAVDETLLYVTNFFAGTVSVVDLSRDSVVDTIPVSTGPYGVAVSHNGDRLYVAHFGSSSDSVSVIDTSSRKVVDTIPVADGPRGVAVNQDGTRLYVTNFFADTVSLIDL